MALYIGSKKVKLYIGSSENLIFNLLASAPVVNGALLYSSDGYALADSFRTYLTAKEAE